MQKKKDPKGKAKKKHEESESELEEEVKEEELEEIIKDIEKNTPEEVIDENKFVKFMLPGESFSPVLDKVGSAPVQRDLEQNFPEPKKSETLEVGGPIKYESGRAIPDYEAVATERRKIEGQKLVARSTTPIRTMDRRIDLRQQREQKFVINPELQALRRDQNNHERDYVAKAEILDRDSHRLPFEQGEKKYEEKTI